MYNGQLREVTRFKIKHCKITWAGNKKKVIQHNRFMITVQKITGMGSITSIP